MSDTPETDALMDVWRVGKLLSVSVMLDHARKLERERNDLLDELELKKMDSQIINDILEVIDPYIDKNDHSKSVDEWIKELIKELHFAKAKVAEVELVLEGYLEHKK